MARLQEGAAEDQHSGPIAVVDEFPNAFLEKLSGLPLISNSCPESKAPYRMGLAELAELKK